MYTATDNVPRCALIFRENMTGTIFNIVKRDRNQNSLLWIFDAFTRDAGYMQRHMFGCQAAYLDEWLYLVVADKGHPWDGLLICTSRERHAALMQDMPALRPHAVLGKWLYVPQDDPEFESIAAKVTAMALARDPRIGVQPTPRKRKKRSVFA